MINTKCLILNKITLKKRITILGFVLCFGLLNAQQHGTVSLNAYGGYTLKETVPFDLVEIKVSDGIQWGAGLEYFLSRSTSLELKYNRLDTDFSTSYINSGVRTPVSTSGSLSYILFGGNGYYIQSEDSKSIPFIGASLGVGIVDSQKTSSDTSFAWDVRAGVKFKTGGPVSVKLQAYVQSILSTYGTDYWYYWGIYYPVPDYHRILQFGVGTVLSYDFNRRENTN